MRNKAEADGEIPRDNQSISRDFCLCRNGQRSNRKIQLDRQKREEE